MGEELPGEDREWWCEAGGGLEHPARAEVTARADATASPPLPFSVDSSLVLNSLTRYFT